MQAVIMGLVRHALTAGGGALLAKGVATEGEIEQLAGALVTIIGVVWSIWAKRREKLRMPADREMVGLLVLIAMIGLGGTGCATHLAQDGPYQGDELLFNTDRTITSAYDVLNTFVRWEYENRESLRRWPEIKEAADEVRGNARRWIHTAITLREAYAAERSEENALALARGLAVLKAALGEAAGYLAEDRAGWQTPALPPLPPGVSPEN